MPDLLGQWEHDGRPRARQGAVRRAPASAKRVCGAGEIRERVFPAASSRVKRVFPGRGKNGRAMSGMCSLRVRESG
ncbi:hypothetical protein San01_49510 [Streptomyces angustmyceticus]|uniref:Uncharacterized protein n=1 Tax=Streptomyces angustmyceticus TaxID=285578 RepID=A0A5J4LJ04_9ACTN|nr:hypothetical protein San01_49510 [Streptomyces angustmyceticus]